MSNEGRGDSVRDLFSDIPKAVYLVAAIAVVLHMAPYWLGHLWTPEGYTFTGINTGSPDYMQYRVWMRQSLSEGWVVTNRLTPENNAPHLPVLLYFTIGHLAQVLGVLPESVYAYVGALFAFVLTVLLFVTVRRFMGAMSGRWTVLLVTLFGGGLGGYLNFAEDSQLFQRVDLLRLVLIDPGTVVPIFEKYRQHFVITTLFDSHFLVIWTLALSSVLALRVALSRPGIGSLTVVVALWGLTSIVHIYSGLTVGMIGLSIALLTALRRGFDPRALLPLVVGGTTVVAVAFWLLLAQRGSGVPMPDWREPLILPTTLLLAFPLQLALAAWAVPAAWREGTSDRVFLLGWVLGCLVLTLAAPYWPYPSRGTMTLQIPLTILAGIAWFSGGRRLTPAAALAIVVLAGSTFVFRVSRIIPSASFSVTQPHKWMSEDHHAIAEASRGAGEGEILLTRPDEARWLLPFFPGKAWVAHFFLTVDFERREEAFQEWLAEGDPIEQRLRLNQWGVDWLYVGTADDPARLEQIPGLTIVVRNGAGTLFRVAQTSGGTGP